MKWIILALLVLLCILTLVCYSLCVIAHQSDERAERMYRKWKEQLQKDIAENGEPLFSDYNLGINHAMCVIEAMKGEDDDSD